MSIKKKKERKLTFHNTEIINDNTEKYLVIICFFCMYLKKKKCAYERELKLQLD